MRIMHDGKLTIATGSSRKETKWTNREMSWSELMTRLKQPTYTGETVEEYRKMTKAKQDDIKDIGGFVGGKLKDGIRKNGSVEHRSVLTLDMDFAQPDVWDTITLLGGCACCIYSTHKHTPEASRLRLVAPLSRTVSEEEYTALAHKFAAGIDIEQFDDTTFESSRLMYWGSTSSDGEHVFESQDGPWLNPDEVLAKYEDWTDASSWQVSSRVGQLHKKMANKQGDPLEKKGVVGAFCRAYSIPEAIEIFLSEIYAPCEVGDRYTFLGGSTSGGLVLYDNDTFAFSHHGTDPISGKLVNSFDMVRIHKYGTQDDGAREGTPANKLPSFVAMTGLVKADALVQKLDFEERMAAIQADFSGEKVNPRKLFFKEEKFIPSYMAEWFLKCHHAYVMTDDLYVYMDGVYVRDERVFLEEGSNALGDEFQTSRLREALAYIKNTVCLVTPEEATDYSTRLNLQNGLLDLKTLELKPHSPEFRTIIQLSVAYDPAADCSAIDTFLQTVVPLDAIPVIEEYSGYCLIPTMRYEKCLLLHGEGGNGKGTLIDVLETLLGPKAVSNVSFQALTENRFATADLFGKMANMHSDIPSKTLENTAQFKEVVSGDMIRAEEKNKPAFSFKNHAKLIYSANEPPASKDNTEGFHRKLLIIPFPTKFTDRKLRKSLFTPVALSGFFLRALQGMQRLQKQGDFTKSETVEKSRAAYRIQSDIISHFLSEYCSFSAEETTGKQALYDAFRTACSRWGNFPVSQTKFNARLCALHPSVVEIRVSTVRSWRGVKVVFSDFLE